ncbi:uncharacterized protein LOC131943497 [Physella acuta]|uniref:uncharacterized protein LOC131943497 n=1 Tax=Physella acuta TaxID=109671 RepID=UPI0027DD72FF|nr:uncharacterized protein LOC131943497 [Physella acuta]
MTTGVAACTVCCALRQVCCHTDATYFTLANEEFQCHCSSVECDKGQCPFDTCHVDWVGPFCQYRNVATEARGIPYDVTDKGDDTCVDVTGSPLLIQLERFEPLAWLRLRLKESATYSYMTLKLHTSSGEVLCDQLRTHSITDLLQDVTCGPDLLYVKAIELTWTGSQICSIYIVKGRNLAVKQKTSMSVQSQGRGVSARAVDGEWGVGAECVNTSGHVGLNHWQVLFSGNARIVHDVIIHTSRGVDVMKTFTLEALDRQMAVTYKHSVGSTGHVTRVLTGSSEPVAGLRLSVNQVTGTYLDICEVLAFGDCAPPYYGLECRTVCDSRCPDRMCHINGECLACPRGRAGPFCQRYVSWRDPEEPRESGYNFLSIAFIPLGMASFYCCLIVCKYVMVRRQKGGDVIGTYSRLRRNTGCGSVGVAVSIKACGPDFPFRYVGSPDFSFRYVGSPDIPFRDVGNRYKKRYDYDQRRDGRGRDGCGRGNKCR